MDVTEDQYIIVATYGSVVFGVGYHSWVVATDNYQFLLISGGTYDGDQLLMTSYRSELGGIASGLVVIGTLVRSGKIKVKSVKLVYDNESAIKACKRKCTQSVFHRTEGDHNLISTIHYVCLSGKGYQVAGPLKLLFRFLLQGFQIALRY
jgi:hypothetical protein